MGVLGGPLDFLLNQVMVCCWFHVYVGIFCVGVIFVADG